VVAWDIAHSLDGIDASAHSTVVGIQQYPAPDPKDMPPPADTSKPTGSAAPPEVQTALPDGTKCYQRSLEVTWPNNGYGQRLMRYDHNVTWCDALDKPGFIRFDSTDLTANVTYCAPYPWFDCTIDATFASNLPAGSNTYPSMSTNVTGTFGVHFSISVGPAGHDFAVTNHAASHVFINDTCRSGTCEGATCRWVPPNT
jgi:hypothetical protein